MSTGTTTEFSIRMQLEDVLLDGDVVVPTGADGIVMFVHGSGSSRHSSRNRFVAEQLQLGGMGTLLFDLLTEEEEAIDLRTGEMRFDIPLLAQRTMEATDWLSLQSFASGLSIGYFGASTGAAAALIAASQRTELVKAVVSRGGRPDLASSALTKVIAPTLLIVGGHDDIVIDLNEQAFAQLNTEKRLVIVPGASHLFEEAGTLEHVAALATDWFATHLTSRR